jgi:tetratricopeptide (TPR) repeat protein
MKVWILVMLFGFVVVRSDVVRADNKADARKHVEVADVSYKLGDFAKALDEYSKAYQVFPVPGLLFNIGQCHRELGHLDQALFFYEGFLRDSPADAPNRSVVEGLANDMRAAIAKQHADKNAADETEAARKRAEDERQRADAEARRREQDEARRREADDRRIADARRGDDTHEQSPFYRKWWFWTAVGGAAALGGAAYYFSGSTTIVQPSGTAGGLDRR